MRTEHSSAGTLPAAEARGLDPADRDQAVDPGQDFYRYANGGWLARNPVPPEYSRWGVFHEVNDRNEKILHEILEEAAAAASQGGTAAQLGAFYASGMDTARIQQAGAAPLRAELERIQAVSSLEQLRDALARLHQIGVPAWFGFGSEVDPADSTRVVAFAFQAGLGLPDRDYYTREDEGSQKLREQYVEHVERMLRLLGDDAAAARRNALIVMEMETALAKASLTNVEMRNPQVYANQLTIAQANALTPSFGWGAYCAAAGVPGNPTVNIVGPKMFQEADRMLAALPLEQWKTYLRWHLVNAAAPYLSSAFEQENFRFHQTVLNGVAEMKPRWKRVLDATEAGLGEPLGRAFVERAFSPAAKQRCEEMVRNLIAAYRQRLANLDWMSPATREQAIAKLDAFQYKIGYPERWRDFSGLQVDRGAFALNVMHATEFNFRYQMSKVGKPVDESEWEMPAHAVNAYYHPMRNEIVFPAGILQPPFFSEHADDAVNYGAMGAVIGHEITHGFDDSGSQFDGAGNLRNWWTEQDRAEFDQRAQAVVEQFNGYVAVDDLHVNGALTLGENIADLGGLNIAYQALQIALQGRPRPPIGGLTPEQRFFLSWAQAWRENARPEAIRVQVNTNPHAPARFRAIGPPSNMPEFARAFGLDGGSPMVRAGGQQVRIW